TLAPPTGRGTAPADVLHRRHQLAVGDGLVGRVARICSLGRAIDAADRPIRRLAARLLDAVPDAPQLLLRLPADHVPEVDRVARHRPLALPAGRGRPVWRTTRHAARRRGLGGGPHRWPADDPGRLAGRPADPGPVAAARPQ